LRGFGAKHAKTVIRNYILHNFSGSSHGRGLRISKEENKHGEMEREQEKETQLRTRMIDDEMTS
jgi:hypothetical protein